MSLYLYIAGKKVSQYNKIIKNIYYSKYCNQNLIEEN